MSLVASNCTKLGLRNNYTNENVETSKCLNCCMRENEKWCQVHSSGHMCACARTCVHECAFYLLVCWYVCVNAVRRLLLACSGEPEEIC
jgi:hypothetical protein